MGRDPFHQPRVLRAPSSLALNPAREVAATASLGSLGQGLITLMVKNFVLISILNLPSFSLKPLPCPVTPGPCHKPLSSSLADPFRHWQAALRSPCSLLFSRLNRPSSPSLSSRQRGSSPRIIAGASSGPAPTGPCLFFPTTTNRFVFS